MSLERPSNAPESEIPPRDVTLYMHDRRSHVATIDTDELAVHVG